MGEFPLKEEWLFCKALRTKKKVVIPNMSCISERRPLTEGERRQPGRVDSLPGRGHPEGHHQPLQRHPDHHGGP